MQKKEGYGIWKKLKIKRFLNEYNKRYGIVKNKINSMIIHLF